MDIIQQNPPGRDEFPPTFRSMYTQGFCYLFDKWLAKNKVPSLHLGHLQFLQLINHDRGPRYGLVEAHENAAF